MREINFGAGRPDPLSFPSDALAQAAAKVISKRGAELVNYPDGRGYEPLRAIASQRFERSEGRAVPLEEIVLTSGSMQALQLITGRLCVTRRHHRHRNLLLWWLAERVQGAARYGSNRRPSTTRVWSRTNWSPC